MKKLLLLFAVVCFAFSANAQNYNYGVGLRLGPTPSLDFKWNFSERHSWEFDLNFPDWDGLNFSAAYEWNWALGARGYQSQGWTFYVGPALTVGMYNFDHAAFMGGVGAMTGIEYKFKFPLALAIDYKPTVTFISKGDLVRKWGFYDFSLAIRYAF